MRSQKLFLVGATIVAASTLASVSFADDSNSAPVTTGAASSNGTSATGQSPGSPSGATTTTSTTASTPTSTTTTTSADDMTAAQPATPPVSSSPTPAEQVTVYDNHRPNRAWLLTGAGVLISTYATTAAFAAANGPVGDKDLFIPVVGPWINLANRSCTGECGHETRDTLLIAGSGVLQGLSAAAVVTSFFIPEKTAVARINAGPVKMNVVPTIGGLGTVGTF